MTFKQVFSSDKLQHAAVCFVLTTIGTALFSAQPARLVWGVCLALLFAAGKEIYDIASFKKEYYHQNDGEYLAKRRKLIVDSIFDIGFDIIGIVIACFCLSAIGA